MQQVYPLITATESYQLPYLSIGMVTAYLRVHDDGVLNKHFDISRALLGGIDGFPLSEIYRQIEQTVEPIALLSSYVWNHELNLEVANRIKAVNPRAIIIIGGPEIPKYGGVTEQFLRNNPSIDIAVLGEGEQSCAEILETLVPDGGLDPVALGNVAGIAFASHGEITRTASRARLRNIDALPSPYLTGEFEPWFRKFANTILETNRGCPFGCTYCDWGSATLQKVTKFNPERVIEEINYIASTEAEAIFIADANFGMLEQDIAIAKALVEARERTGFPKRLYTNFAKNGGRRLMEVIKILHAGGLLPTGVVALQTTDKDTLQAIKRDNIKTSSYVEMMEFFNREGIPMASDIMIGLPGQTVDSLHKDLQFCIDWKLSANGNYTSMMPNAPMAATDYRDHHEIQTDQENLITSTSSFTEEDLAYMKSLFMAYQFHVRLGILKYYLYYLQLEHRVQAIDFLRRWLDQVRVQNRKYPISLKLYEEVFAMEKRSGDWALMSWGEEALFFFQNLEDYFEELYCFTLDEFRVAVPESERATLATTQSAVSPRMGRSYPYSVKLEHDVPAYFEQIKEVACISDPQFKLKPLSSYPPGTLDVTPGIKQKKSIKFVKIDGHSDDWELPSKLRFY